MRTKTFVPVLVLILIAAGVFRFTALSTRPMHTDEAVHAFKLGQLLRGEGYQYDPLEYHGPTLNYFTLPGAWVSNQTTFCRLQEWLLRSVPAFFGLLTAGLVFLAFDGLGKRGTTAAALLTTVSAAMVFYSRYYIQEMLLVCFVTGVIVCLWRYWRDKRRAWMLAVGIFAGLAHATKETVIISAAAIAVGFLFAAAGQIRKADKPALAKLWAEHKRGLLWALAGWFVVWLLFFSSFFTHWQGLVDSFATFTNYLHRAGDNGIHRHPWYYYLQVLFWTNYEGAPFWSEWIIAVLALVGAAAAIRAKRLSPAKLAFGRFTLGFTLFTWVVYSAIGYKTPWSILTGLLGLILLAGTGTQVLFTWANGKTVRKTVVWVLLIVGTGHLAWQGYQNNFVYYMDTRNPFVYSHPKTDVIEIGQRAEAIARSVTGNFVVWVIAEEGDYWPLPWYLRCIENVGYFENVGKDTPAAEMVLVTPALEGELVELLYSQRPPGQRELYVSMFDKHMELRPLVEIRGYVTKSVWDEYVQARSRQAK